MVINNQQFGKSGLEHSVKCIEESVNLVIQVCGFFRTFAPMKTIKLLFLSFFTASAAMAQSVTDVHSHIISPEFLSALESEGRLMDEGFPLPKYDTEAHLKWMNEAGVKTGAHSPEAIRLLLTITTPDHLLYGSDFPYAAPQVLTKGLQRMKQYLTTETDLAPYKDMILWKNADLLFNIKQ